MSNLLTMDIIRRLQESRLPAGRGGFGPGERQRETEDREGPRRTRPLPIDLWVDLIQHARIRDRLPEVRQAAHPGDEALDPHAEAAVREGSVLAHVQVPLEGLDRQVVLAD